MTTAIFTPQNGGIFIPLPPAYRKGDVEVTYSLKRKSAEVKQSKLYNDLNEAFKEVKDMIDGRQPERTWDEMIKEVFDK